MYAFIMGVRSGDIAKKVISTSDLKSIHGFTNVSDFVTRVSKQNLKFNRIVVLAHCVQSEQDLKNLRELLNKQKSDAQIVLIAREWETSDLQILSVYYKVFTSPIYIDYTMKSKESTDTEFLVYICTSPVDSLRNKHSYYKDVKPKVKISKDVDEYSQSEVKSKKLPNCTYSDGLVKKFSHGGKFFGKNKLTKKELEALKPLFVQANAVLGIRGV